MVSAKFGDGAAGICLAMRSFIAVVIRQAVGDEHDKLIGHAGLLLEQLPGMPHGSTDSRKPGGPEQCEPLASLTAKRSEEHTSELQSLMRISYAVFCLKKKNKKTQKTTRQIMYIRRKT